MDVGYINLHRDEMKLLENNTLYHELIGCLLYISINTRPDIAAVVSILSRHVSRPTESDWVELKRLIKYLIGTKDLKLKLESKKTEVLVGYADADWAQNRDDRKSNSGYIFKYRGACISWSCRKQNCVSLSSTEAEYIALAEACQEALWLRKLILDFELSEVQRITIFEDNQSCVKLVDNEKFSRRTKHIDTKYHFVRDLKQKDIVNIQYCPTDNMVADLLTKPLHFIKLNKFRSELLLK